jgi:subtilisin-like proprotein convertase family protein
MKPIYLAVLLSLAASLGTQAALFSTTYSTGFQNGGVILDGTIDGLTDTRSISGVGGPITDIQVTLNFSGGYNGDLYVYLLHGSEMVVLINRVGVSGSDAFGYADGGMSITLAATAANGDIHNYGGTGIPTGTYSADGRVIDPLSSSGAFDAAGTTSLADFNGANANGSWTLYVADVVGSGNPSTLVSWGLDITAVPEPTTVALGCFAGVFGIVALFRIERVRKLLRLPAQGGQPS